MKPGEKRLQVAIQPDLLRSGLWVSECQAAFPLARRGFAGPEHEAPEMANNSTDTTTRGARLLNIRQVADLLGCSTRKVYSLVDSRMMPRPIRLGGSIRWDSTSIEQWITDGCPAIKGAEVGR